MKLGLVELGLVGPRLGLKKWYRVFLSARLNIALNKIRKTTHRFSMGRCSVQNASPLPLPLPPGRYHSQLLG